MKYFFIAVFSICSYFSVQAQSNSVLDDPRVKEAYNGVEKEFTPEQQVWIKNILDRCEIQEMPTGAAAKQYPLLSSINMVQKYGTSNSSTEVNPLKYTIDFYKSNDQVFRVDGTNKVLIVRGKK